MNSAQLAVTAIPASLVLISGSGLLALRSAVRKGCTVTFGVSFKLAPPPQPQSGTASFRVDASQFQKSLDEALAGAARETAAMLAAGPQPAPEAAEARPSPVPAPVQAAA